MLDEGWRALHHRFGTPWRSIDTVAVAQVAIVLISGGEISWLARAYAIAVVIAALLKLAALVRYRVDASRERAPTGCRSTSRSAAGNGRLGSSAPPLLLAIAAGALVARRDPPSLAGLCV